MIPTELKPKAGSGLGKYASLVPALAVVLSAASPARADTYEYRMRSDLVSAVDGTKAVPLDIRIEGHCKDGRAIYRVTNEGGTWPTRGTLEIYQSYGRISGPRKPIVRREFTMQAGAVVTLKVSFKGHPHQSLDMRFKPGWLGQEFQHTFKHTPRPENRTRPPETSSRRIEANVVSLGR